MNTRTKTDLARQALHRAAAFTRTATHHLIDDPAVDAGAFTELRLIQAQLQHVINQLIPKDPK